MARAVAGGAVAGGVSSGVEDMLSGNTCLKEGLANAVVSMGIGGVAGPIGRIAVPIKPGTFMPKLWTLNGALANPKGLGPNSKKLIGQEAYSSAYSGLFSSTVAEVWDSGDLCSDGYSEYYLMLEQTSERLSMQSAETAALGIKILKVRQAALEERQEA